tara:strand:- start:1139 stop:1240 length:102 start_codon:yes stop_codon:yes gene_type:complete
MITEHAKTGIKVDFFMSFFYKYKRIIINGFIVL